MLKDNIWEEEFRVLSYHMDPNRKALLTSICNFLQEGASMHAEAAGFGFENMNSQKQVWVLARLKVIIEEYPVWKDFLTLKTWSGGKEGIFYLRDFYIEDKNKKSIIKASSSWAALNIETGRPEVVVDLEKGLFTVKDKTAFNESLSKLPKPDNMQLLRSRKIEYTDIDPVFHVNNVKYVELIVNSFSMEQHQSATIYGLEINYLGEVKYGDAVSIFASSLSEKTQNIQIFRESDNKEVCRARLTWQF